MTTTLWPAKEGKKKALCCYFIFSQTLKRYLLFSVLCIGIQSTLEASKEVIFDDYRSIPVPNYVIYPFISFVIKTYELLCNDNLSFEEEDVELLRSPNEKVVLSRSIYLGEKTAQLRKKVCLDY